MITKKPWGYFETFSINEKCTVKLITLNSGGRLSLQIHKRRDELWIALDSGLIVEIGSKKKKARIGEKFHIPKGTLHRASATRKARILEISTGHFDENDIVRIEDDYGRA
jgi:mannose-6-phosphate isomerase